MAAEIETREHVTFLVSRSTKLGPETRQSGMLETTRGKRRCLNF
jgi:hypothetical protein